MMKADVLELLATMESICVDEAADVLGIARPTMSMALLRLTRQGLATRWREGTDPRIRYAISPRGADRLAYLTGRT
jgi:DNA-binding MarR family transcriptional regulator